MEMTLDGQGSLPVRQMAALLLKQYVDTHWCEDAEKFRPPEATPQAKAMIRKHLPMGLKESISKVGKDRHAQSWVLDRGTRATNACHLWHTSASGPNVAWEAP